MTKESLREMNKSVWQGLVISAYRALILMMRVVPLRPTLPVGAALGTLAYYLSGRYRQVGLKNLRLAYGDELTEGERRHILRGVFQGFAKAALFEFPCAASISPSAVRRWVKLAPEDKARIDALIAQDRGLIVVSAHLGNFEFAARRLSLEGYRASVVVRNDGNAALAAIFNRVRGKAYDVLGRGDAVRPILKHLRARGIVAMLPDQKSEDVFVPFFGRPAGTVAGPAVLALRTGAPLLPIFSIRQPDDTHRIEVGVPIDTTPTQDPEADARRIMTEVNAVIEAVVRRHPDQWLWLHDRWRLPPAPDSRRDAPPALSASLAGSAPVGSKQESSPGIMNYNDHEP